MSKYIQVVTTVGNPRDAAAIARKLVAVRLAACVQVSGPITSTYRWQGAVETSEEWCCAAKTRQELYAGIEAAILEAHPYDEPEIVALPIVDGSSGYLAWIDAETDNS